MDRVLNWMKDKPEITPTEIRFNTISQAGTATQTASITANTKKCTCSIWSRTAPNKLHIFMYNFFGPFIVIATAAFIAYYFHFPCMFPSLGATAFLHFAIPTDAVASPRNTLFGHLIGIVAGSISLHITGCYDQPNVFVEGEGFNRIFCCALSVGLSCCAMMLLNISHAPSGATTLIVSLGIMETPFELLIMMTAVVAITVEGWIINRIFRKDAVYPIWSAPKPTSLSSKVRQDVSRSLAGELYNLKKKMENLTVDNFLTCFQSCTEMEIEEIMDELIQFAMVNQSVLTQRKEYQQQVPYSFRAFVDQDSRDDIIHIEMTHSLK